MATSYTFTRTREQLRDAVARKLGIKESGQPLPAEDAVIVDEAIDFRLKELHTLGVLWWNVAPVATDVTMTAGQESAAIVTPDNDFLYPVTFTLAIGNERRPINIVDHASFNAIEDRSSRGEPNIAYFSGATVYLNPIPQAAYTAKITYQAIAADSAANTAPDVLVSAMRAFAVVVAADLLLDFQIQPAQAQMILSQAPAAMTTIKVLNNQRTQNTAITPEWF